jgi:hypothetical protein
MPVYESPCPGDHQSDRGHAGRARGLYLAYDLLGGQHGPLRLLTRAVTYSIIFGAFYTLGLGPIFGIGAGLTTGITVAFELNRVAIGKGDYSRLGDFVCSSIRGIGFAIGLDLHDGFSFAMVFAAMIIAGQMVGYYRGMRPSLNYHPGTRPRITRRQWQGTAVRTVGYALAGLLSGIVTHHQQGALPYALRVGITTGVATAFGIMAVPVVEYYADHLPERRMGVFGILLILCGFGLQSVQYWLVLFDIPLK